MFKKIIYRIRWYPSEDERKKMYVKINSLDEFNIVSKKLKHKRIHWETMYKVVSERRVWVYMNCFYRQCLSNPNWDIKIISFEEFKKLFKI